MVRERVGWLMPRAVWMAAAEVMPVAAEVGFQVGRGAVEHEWIIASIFMF